MSLVPTLRVVPIDSVRRHEEVDPIRVADLRERIASERVQVNPVIATPAGDNYVVLDGATRTEAMRSLELPFLVIQPVEHYAVTRDTWHHVIRASRTGVVIERISSDPG